MAIMIYLIIIFLLIFILAFFINPKNDNEVHIVEHQNTKVKNKNRVQSYDKWEKKIKKKSAKTAMELSNNKFLSIQDANELFIYMDTNDERKLLDIILEAKLDGKDMVKLDMQLYNRLYNAHYLHVNEKYPCSSNTYSSE